MQLADLEKMLNITVLGTPQEAVYDARLASAIDYVKSYCRNDFLVEQEDGSLLEVIPVGAQMGIAMLVKSMGEGQNIQSQSLGDMSKSFFEGATGKEAKRYLKPYVKVFI